jgi:enoyl-[acyl-carrier protein] reductase/trans-2-enoyl-CoA reductase (NAD+)
MNKTIKPIIVGNVVKNHNPVGIALNMKEDLELLVGTEQDLSGKTVLVLGCSTGYGLAARQVLAMRGANTVGIAFERPVSAGMSNIEEFEGQIGNYIKGSHHKTFMGDCFTDTMKGTVCAYLIKNKLQLSEVVYSVAAGRRIKNGAPLIDGKPQYTFSSLGAIGKEVTGLTLDLETETMFETTLPALSDQQIKDTVTVMGGEDWAEWIENLSTLNLLTKDSTTYALSYVGTDLNAELYRDGSLGAAKDNLLEAKAYMEKHNLTKPEVVVCRALVTRASAYIPSFAPYIMALEQVHRELGLLETPLDQMISMFSFYNHDDKNRLRIDEFETHTEVQNQVAELLSKLTPDNFKETVAYDLFKKEILKQNGFRDDV